MEKTAELNITRMSLADIKPHPRNPRRHPEPGSRQWNTLEASLAHDYFDPMVVNQRNGMLVSGHFRHRVLTHLGYTDADVSVVDYDEATHLARLIAANTLLGDWESEMLGALAKDIDLAGLESSLAGWDEKEMAERLKGPTITEPATTAANLVSLADQLQAEWKVAPGDLWQIGEHRVFCGDSTETSTWETLLEGREVDLIWTDPPYNVDYLEGQQHRMECFPRHLQPQEIANDKLSEEKYAALLLAAFTRAFEITKAGGPIYIAHADSQGLANRQAMINAGWKLAQNLVWVKNNFAIGRQDYKWQHEPILYGWKPGAAHYWQGGFSQTTVIEDEEKDLGKLNKKQLIEIIQRLRNARDTTIVREPRTQANDLHPTIKPLSLVARQVFNSSKKGDLVADLFPGSGTTLVAAHQTGRRGVASEKEPKFCAVILQRMKEQGLTPEKIRSHA